jgi:hypothetical protein
LHSNCEVCPPNLNIQHPRSNSCHTLSSIMIFNILLLALAATQVSSQAQKPPCANPGLLSAIVAVCGDDGRVNATCQCQNIDPILLAAVPVLDALCDPSSVAGEASSRDGATDMGLTVHQSHQKPSTALRVVASLLHHDQPSHPLPCLILVDCRAAVVWLSATRQRLLPTALRMTLGVCAVTSMFSRLLQCPS